MSDWYLIAAVALLLYLLECLAWIEAAAVVCCRTARRRWSCSAGSTLPGNSRGGVIMADPIGLSGSVVVCHVWPFVMTTDGVASVPPQGWSAEGRQPRYVRFDQVARIDAKLGDIRINDEPFLSLASPERAEHAAAMMRRVRQRAAADRASEIEAVIDETLDPEPAAQSWAAFAERTRVLRALAATLFAYTCLVAPMVIVAVGPIASWKLLLAGWLTLSAAVAVVYVRTHAAMYPRGSFDRWTHAGSFILLPLSAIRCVDRLSRDALCRYDAVAVAPMLCGADAARPLLRQQVVDLRADVSGPVDPSDASAIPASVRWFQELLLARTEAAAERLHLDIFRAPAREDATMCSYCPRCHAQFQAEGKACPDCPGVALAPFP